MFKVKTVLKAASVPLALALIILLASARLPYASGATIVIETTLPKVPSHMNVLKTVSKEITREQALDIASRIFNVTGDAQFAEGVWKVVEGSREVLMYRSGTVKYFDNSKILGEHVFATGATVGHNLHNYCGEIP